MTDTTELDSILNMSWKQLPVGKHTELSERLEIVNDFLVTNAEPLRLELAKILTLPISLETDSERRWFAETNYKYARAITAKRSLERELQRRGKLNEL